MKKKAVKIFLFIFLGFTLISAILSSIYVFKDKEKKKNLEDKITNTLKEAKKIESENKDYKATIEEKKEELKDKIEEEESWKKTEEKINQAL